LRRVAVIVTSDEVEYEFHKNSTYKYELFSKIIIFLVFQLSGKAVV